MFVVRVDQTYYGGIPRKAKKMVKFNLAPNSVFTPRLKCILPILKRDGATSPGKTPIVHRVEENVSSFASSDGITRVRNSNQQKNVRHNVIKDEFASICLQAARDFVVVKELITNSKTLQTSTSFTLRSKESLAETNEIAVKMKDFYTSPNLPEHSYDWSQFKPSTRLLEMEI